MNKIKKTHRSAETKKNLINRLNRINGQVNGVKKMIEEDSYCNDILIQLSAIKNSVQSLSNELLDSHLRTCITKGLQKGNLDAVDEVVNLFKKFNN
ncbi:copper-sensing transcriptional repressor CsoR [Firmicutes bacterium CAG:822]|nr:copper-sensing transcriptional repressor CsoR [Firmicutes bacterium CAG:822]